MGGSGSYRLARKIANARMNGAPQSEIDDLERRHQQALADEREKRAMKSSDRSVITEHVDYKHFQWDKSYQGTPNRDYGKANTADALDEIKGNNGSAPKKNSLSDYLDENGNLSPERAALHKQIIDNYIASKIPVPEGETPTMVMFGGGPASGKSTVLNQLYEMPDEASTVKIDPDDIKSYLPGYSEMAEVDEGAAGFYHEESSMIAKQLAEVLFKENYNTIYDGTGDGSVKSVMAKINGARSRGYKVNAAYVTIDTDEALVRNRGRYERAKERGEVARLPDPEMVKATHKKVTQILMQLSGEFDSVKLYDNNGTSGKLIATGKRGGSLTPVKGEEKAFDGFVRKGNE